jgi:hypothetical protein
LTLRERRRGIHGNPAAMRLWAGFFAPLDNSLFDLPVRDETAPAQLVVEI